MSNFTGFPKAGLQFFNELAANNNRDWFQEHKVDFQANVQQPAQAFVLALGEKLQAISNGIRYDTKLSGAGSIMRIYRDVRFSADKTPYKTYMGIVFWEGPGKKTEEPAFYIGLDGNGAKVYAGMYGFPKPMLNRYREAVADDKLGSELAVIMVELQASGQHKISEPHYKRVPRGYDQDHPRADLLRQNGLGLISPQIGVEAVTRTDFVDTCLAHCQQMAPLQQWLVKVSQG